MSDKSTKREYKGRRKIYTDVSEITTDNVIQVLNQSLLIHSQNREDIDFLINFEKGFQPLQREKVVRTDIDVVNIDNLAHQITEFWLGYFWGNHMAFVQKSDKHPKQSNPDDNNSAITLLNEMYSAEDMERKDQLLAYYLEVCGTCCQLIDIKRTEDDSLFDLVTLNPRYSFVVYSSNAYERPVMGVSFSENEDRTKIYTCITNDTVYIIKDAVKITNGKPKTDKDGKEVTEQTFTNRSGEANPFGMINIVEFERSTDRTGVFERQIDELNALNILESDLVNDVAQTTQANWWGNDIEFPQDTDGNQVEPTGGQWILTKTSGQGQKPSINALVLDYNYDGIIKNIQNKHDGILERTFTPLQKDQSGGSTTGATSLSSGWTAAEAVACKQSAIIKSGYKQRNKLVLKAIQKTPFIEKLNTEYVELKDLKNTDIEIRPIRQKNFDLNSKVNALSTMVKVGVNPRIAMETIDLFSNLAEAVEDSVESMKKYQESLIKQDNSEEFKQNDNGQDINRGSSDMSDQVTNSPLKDL